MISAVKNRKDGQLAQRGGRSQKLEDSPMMDRLLKALQQGTDIGHYGRLTFTIVARHFMKEREILNLLAKQPEIDEVEAQALLLQVQERNYNPPSRERILEWQERQDFPICPNPEDPASCNVYSELAFPDDVYEQIEEYWVERLDSDAGNG